ncbi:hypothetical protein ACQP00_11915 [Dactylosporangium sp. CS-047395]|uniref:hypothetical protein n=1 Tax=Dactylosporangium sp. CS-047395 TaxID=3239936 RepID=UPI003D8DA814
MERLPLDENAAAVARLKTLIDSLGDEGLAKPVAPGWSVATVLAELAFWDRWALTLMRRWRSGHLPPPTVPNWYDDAINDTLLPTWQALPGPVAAQLACHAAEEADLEIRKAETPVVAGILAAGQANLLNRYVPRNAALDRIEAAL